MTKSTIWKLIFIGLIFFGIFLALSPFEDRELGEYAESQASTTADPEKYPEHVSFSDVTSNIRAGLEEGQPITFENLRNYGKENRLDFSAYFQPPEGVLNTIFSTLFPSLLKTGTNAMIWFLELCWVIHKLPLNLASIYAEESLSLWKPET